MKQRSSLVVIICCLIVQLINLRNTNFQIIETSKNSLIIVYGVQGLTYLSYPLLGHLADVYLTRYRALKCGLVMLIGSSLYSLFYAIASIIAFDIFDSRVIDSSNIKAAAVVVPGFCFFVVGIGFLEANGIQFGLDQLLEAPTPKLIAFIHWYYWAQSVGKLIIFYTVTICYSKQ